MAPPLGPDEPIESDLPTPPDGSLTRAAVGGVAWQVLSYVLGKVLVFASTVVLARILTPRDFGVVGLALVFITFAEVATDLGVAQALVFLPLDRRRVDTALVLALAWSGVLVAVAMLVAPAVQSFFDDSTGTDSVTTIFRVLSISLLVSATAQVPDALLRKTLRFRQQIIANLIRTVAQGTVSIVLALAGLGPWAIVYGLVAGEAARSVACWTLVDHRPRLRFHLTEARGLIAYGAPAAGSALLLSLVFNVDYLIVGERLGAEALGYYTLAFRIPQMVIIHVLYAVSTVAFPVFSLARGEPERLKRGYLKSMRLQTAYGVAVGVGLAVTAPMLVDVVFGSRWAPSVVPLQAIALYAAFRSLGTGAGDVYKAIGRPGISVWLSLVRLAVVVPALLVASRWGINGVSWAQAAVAFVGAAAMQSVAARVLRVPLTALARSVAPAVTMGLGVAAGGLLARWLMPGPVLVRLAAVTVCGGSVALAAVWAAHRGFLSELRALVQRPIATNATPP